MSMKRICKLSIGTLGVLFFGVVLPVDTVSGQTAKDLVGTWTLVSALTEEGGTKTLPYGPNPKALPTSAPCLSTRPKRPSS